MTREEKLNEIIEQFGLDDDSTFVFIGDTSTMYDDAIIGITEIYDNGKSEYVLVYDYYKMVDCQIDSDGCCYTDAVEWIDYNVIRALPYKLFKNKANPIIVRPLVEL